MIPRRDDTRPLNQSKLDVMSERKAASASGVVRSNGLGDAFKGADFSVSMLTPSFSRRPTTFGNWNSTPMEPTSEVCCATMWSVPMAAM